MICVLGDELCPLLGGAQETRVAHKVVWVADVVPDGHDLGLVRLQRQARRLPHQLERVAQGKELARVVQGEGEVVGKGND